MKLYFDLFPLGKHTISRVQQPIHVMLPPQFRDILIYAFDLECLAFSAQVYITFKSEVSYFGWSSSADMPRFYIAWRSLGDSGSNPTLNNCLRF